jgi:hypothetical protein
MPDEKKQAFIMQSHPQPVWQSQGNCRRSVISRVSMARYIAGHALNVKGGFCMGWVASAEASNPQPFHGVRKVIRNLCLLL